jgi:prephenate dehydratase
MIASDSEPAYRNAGCRVAFQGEHGAFSEKAAGKLLGPQAATIPCASFEKLFAAIEDGVADLILAPMENTLAGSVYRCYDLLIARDLRIRAEVIHPIAHFLVGAPGAALAGIRTVESHPVALAQCERFFAGHPRIARVAAQDTAGSVREVVAANDPTRAAIGGRHAAELYGGAILAEHLEDDPANFTRFLLLSKPESAQPQLASPQGPWKMSLMLQLSHKPGSLCDALAVFAKRGISLLKIESRPIAGQPWEYRFYLDLSASPEEIATQEALHELRSHAASVLELGSYCAARNPPVA